MAFAGLNPKTNLADRVNVVLKVMTDFHPQRDTMYGHELIRQGRAVSATVRSASERDASAPLASVVFELTCPASVLNPMGSMHGGCVATVYDNFSTYARAVLDTYWEGLGEQGLESYVEPMMGRLAQDFGVSRMLQVIYHRGVKEGDRVFLAVELVSDSRRFTTYTGRMYDGAGRVFSVMAHDKVKSGPNI